MTFARTLQCSFSELCINFLVLESCGKFQLLTWGGVGRGGQGWGEGHPCEKVGDASHTTIGSTYWAQCYCLGC